MAENGGRFTSLKPQAPPLSSGPAPLGAPYHVALASIHPSSPAPGELELEEPFVATGGGMMVAGGAGRGDGAWGLGGEWCVFLLPLPCLALAAQETPWNARRRQSNRAAETEEEDEDAMADCLWLNCWWMPAGDWRWLVFIGHRTGRDACIIGHDLWCEGRKQTTARLKRIPWAGWVGWFTCLWMHSDRHEPALLLLHSPSTK